MTTILLVDDDPLQASLMLSVLGRRFCDVRRAKDAAQALCLIEQPEFAGGLGLVISGHHTPEVGGPAFVGELRSRMPNLPVLVIGTARETQADYAYPRVVFLPKPYTSETMLTLTGEMLAGRKSAVA